MTQPCQAAATKSAPTTRPPEVAVQRMTLRLTSSVAYGLFPIPKRSHCALGDLPGWCEGARGYATRRYGRRLAAAGHARIGSPNE